jgi:hypothetical protein
MSADAYVVVAFRYGGFSNVFPVGVFSSRDEAVAAADSHRRYRGGKYDHRVYRFLVDEWDDDVGHAGNQQPCIEWEPGHREPNKRAARDSIRDGLVETIKLIVGSMAKQKAEIAQLQSEIDRLRLTDAEREAIEMAADDNRYHQDPGGRAAYIERTLRGLLERIK